MKNLRQLCMALVLTLTLSAAAFAQEGKVNCPGVTQPPPEDLTSETQSDGETDSAITEVLLLLIEGVLVP